MSSAPSAPAAMLDWLVSRPDRHRHEHESSAASIMASTQQFWDEFLDLYKENNCLWDIQSSTYTRRDLRNAAYDVLLDKYREIEPSATMDMVKKKIDVFRTGYRREQRKVMETRVSGLEYIPTLWYYNKLNFLDFPEDTDASEIKLSSIKCNESDDQAEIEYIDIPEEYTAPNPVIKYRMKKRRKLDLKPRPRPQPQQTSPVTSTPSTLTYETEEDDCATYCASLKLQMRELETQQKYIAQKLISDVIFLARTSQLTLDSCINSQPF